jgi:hypothetical protein
MNVDWADFSALLNNDSIFLTSWSGSKGFDA